MNRLVTGLLLAAFALGAQGCLYLSAEGSFGPRLAADQVARIVPGETTKRQMLEWFGPPEEFIRSEVIESLADETTRVSGAIALGNRAQDAFSWQHDNLEGSGIALLVFNSFRAQVESDLLVVFFDENDVVREYTIRTVGAGE